MTRRTRAPIHQTWIGSDRYVPRRFIRPIQTFLQIEAASGIVLVVAAVVAVIWANSALADSYFSLLEAPFRVEIGPIRIIETNAGVVNDGLMVIFFFVVGLEIKRELVVGELSDPKAATLPVVAAVGGMLFPAIIYLAVVQGPEATRGWGVPVATDIAFAVGVLALLGRRVPSGVKLFLLALAIADDLGGILVIALFYATDLSLGWLAVAGLGLLGVGVANRVGIRHLAFYLPTGVFIWYCFLRSGVHATVAGVALAMLTPTRPMYGVKEFDRKARIILDTYPPTDGTTVQREHADHEALLLAEISRESVAPLVRNHRRLTSWASFVVIPIFALANAGVRFEGGLIEAVSSPVGLGVGLGLVAGKTAGISFFTWLAVRLGWGRLPAGATWRHMIGVAAVAGIGFTVALFIAALAFSDPVLADQAKVGIFSGSIVAGLLGWSILAGATVGTEEDS